jgi:hypothetical protein
MKKIGIFKSVVERRKKLLSIDTSSNRQTNGSKAREERLNHRDCEH